MKRFALSIIVSTLSTVIGLAESAQPEPLLTVAIWPEGKMPGKPATQPETEHPSKDEFHRITNVSWPTLAIYPATQKSAPAMIVCPGGGYSYVVIDKEGTEIAQWLNAHGITAIVLKYRVPHNRDGALQDLERSLRLARTNADEWHIDPKRLGVIGFSAGGNLAAKASTLFDKPAYAPIDSIDDQSCRPDFAVLVYPAYLDDRAGKISPDLNLQANIPPTLIVHNNDDETFFPGSKLYDAALTEGKHPHEFQVYPTGGHGYGLHCTRDARAWPEDAMKWLKKNGFQ